MYFILWPYQNLGRLGKFTRKHIGGTVGRYSHLTGYIYHIFHHRHLARSQFSLYSLRLLERHHYHLFPDTDRILLRCAQRLGISDQSRLLRVFEYCAPPLVFIGRYITGPPPAHSLVMLGATFKFSSETLFDGTLLTLGLDKGAIITVLAGIVAVIYVELLQERESKYASHWKSSFLVQWLAILYPDRYNSLGILNQEYISAEFIYAQF